MLPEARRLIFAGKFGEANNLVGSRMMARPLGQLQYQTLGDLLLQFPETKEVENYRRDLNLDTAIATTSYTADGVRFTREALPAPLDGVIVVRLTADKPGQISFTAGLKTPHKATVRTQDGRHAGPARRQRTVAGHRRGVEIRGPRPRHGHRRKDRGRKRNDRRSRRRFGRAADRCGHELQEIQRYQRRSRKRWSVHAWRWPPKKSFDELRQAHVAEHQRLFRRVALDLGTSDATKLPTDERIKGFAAGKDPQLAALYFQYGRYLLISSSRTAASRPRSRACGTTA